MFGVQTLQRDAFQKRDGPSASVARIISSSVSLKHESSKPMRAASARKTSTLDRVSPGAGTTGRASCRW